MTNSVFDKVSETVPQAPPPPDYQALIDEVAAERAANPETEEGEEETQEATKQAETSPEGDKAEEEAKPEGSEEAAKTLSKREELKLQTKREREYRAREEAIKHKEEQVQQFDQILSIAKDDPEKLLTAAGWDIDKFLEWKALQLAGQIDLPPEEKQKLTIREEIKRAQEEERARLDSIEKAKSEKEIAFVKDRVSQVLQDNPEEYPLTVDEEEYGQETVFELYRQTIESDPTQRGVYTIRDAAKQVETHFMNKLKEKVSKHKRLFNSEPVNSEDEATENTPKETAAQKTSKPKTITNKVGMQSTDFQSAPTARKVTHNDPDYIDELVREYEAGKAAKKKR